MNTLRQLRNFWIPLVTTIVLGCFSDAVAQVRYQVTDLGTLNNDNFSCAMAVNKRGWTEIQDGVEDPVSNSLFANLVAGHAVLNIGELKIDLTLGGPNSWMGYGGLNDHGEAVGFAETTVPDPDGEDVCAFGTKRTCSPFLWRNGHMRVLPTVGGNNGQAFAINNRGQIAGFAETAVPDSTCPTPSKTDSAVIWEHGEAQALPRVGGDPDAQAQGINEHGQAVGYSGNCTTAFHAVLWEDGNAFQLPSLGPVERSNIAWAINDQGQIVGQSRSSDGKTRLAVLWQNGEITKLGTGTLPGDFGAIATGINNRGQVVGSTNDSGFNWSHGFIWENGVMTDLNTLFPADSNLFVTMANTINERGQITGMATVRSGPHTGDIHAFLATPVEEREDKSIADIATTQPKLPANVGNQLLQRFGPGRFDQ